MSRKATAHNVANIIHGYESSTLLRPYNRLGYCVFCKESTLQGHYNTTAMCNQPARTFVHPSVAAYRRLKGMCDCPTPCSLFPPPPTRSRNPFENSELIKRQDDSRPGPDIGKEVPVTPGVGLSGQSAYFETERPGTAGSEQQAFDPKKTAPGPTWNANTYIDANKEDSSESAATQPAESSLDPVDRTKYKKLNLTGRVISATFNVPYNIGFSPGKDWELNPRRGTSALFDSFSYLASPASNWNHTLVGWTGEITRVLEEDGSMVLPPLNKLSQPVPVPGKPKPIVWDPEVGLKITRDDRRRLEKQLERDHGGKIVPVWLDDEATNDDDEDFVLKDQKRWRQYAQKELYTVFHYKQNEPTDGRAARIAWADYYKMNKRFADRILEIYTPGDVIIIHDYNLMLLPSLLRQKLPNVFIGFYLHIPFPSSEYYRCLSRRKEILEGVLGANMVGFQSFSYSRHFASCCTRVLGFDSSTLGVDAYGAHVAVDVMPIGIDAASTLHSAFEDTEVASKIAGIKELYAGKKIIIGRDRLDSVRGIAQKLQAFERFLKDYPEMSNQVVLIQITSPNDVNTEGKSGEARANQKISDLAAKINGEYGTIGFAPVRLFPHYLSREEYFALLRVADTALITSVRDGMNTMSMEYAICQKDNHSPVILSEFSGTSGNLDDALHVNPWNIKEVADTIHQALTMSADERKERAEKLYKRVLTHNVQNWTNIFIKKLLTALDSFDQKYATPVLNRANLLQDYRDAHRRIFMFDYDGTLTPIVKDPNAAIPSDRVIRNLKALAADPDNSVWIISGRDQSFLEEWMGHITNLGLSAEHGCFMRRPGQTEWENLLDNSDMSWQDRVLKVFQAYTDTTQGSFIERKRVALTWHYRRSDPEYGAFQASQCRKELEATVAKEYDIEVMAGKANLEVRPKFVNKGEIVKRLIKEYGDQPYEQPDFVFCSGDDFTDEDMFRSLRQSILPTENVFAVTVGPSSKQTLASWHLLEPSDVISCISLLNGSADAGNAGAVSVVEGHVPESRL